MKMTDVIKSLITGFWQNGFIALCRVVYERWVISLLIVFLITYLCSDPETAVYAWVLIGVFAIYSAIKAIIDIFVGIINYIKTRSTEEKALVLQKLGGKIFDFLLCVVGIFQALKTISHISKVTKSTSSAVSVIDDVAGAISKLLENLKK